MSTTINNTMNDMEKTICDCGHLESDHSSITRGYGRDENGKTYCYECCAENDRQYMRDNGCITLYLTDKGITNWPGSLVFTQTGKTRIGRHNWAGNRYDVWFKFEGETWHGVQYGDNTQICHCKRVKS